MVATSNGPLSDVRPSTDPARLSITASSIGSSTSPWASEVFTAKASTGAPETLEISLVPKLNVATVSEWGGGNFADLWTMNPSGTSTIPEGHVVLSGEQHLVGPQTSSATLSPSAVIIACQVTQFSANLISSAYGPLIGYGTGVGFCTVDPTNIIDYTALILNNSSVVASSTGLGVNNDLDLSAAQCVAPYQDNDYEVYSQVLLSADGYTVPGGPWYTPPSTLPCSS